MQNDEIKTRRNTSILYVDGYELRRKSFYKNRWRYVCTDKLKTNCKACGYLENGVMVMTKQHYNHIASKGQANRELFKDKLWEQVKSTEDESRVIWERLAIDFPEAAAIVTYPSIERQMGRWRAESRPPCPKSLTEFMTIINSQQWNKYREYTTGKFLTVHTIVVDRETSVTIIGDPDFLSSLEHVTELYVDATFEICPRKIGIYQFLSILGKIDDTATPLAWAFMSKKSGKAYNAVFNYFRTTLAPRIHPEIVHMDFEKAIRNAIKKIYPDITIIFCYFHHCQALWKKLKKRGKIFIAKLVLWDLALAFYRKLLGLALLPVENICAAFKFLIKNTGQDVLDFFGEQFIFNYYEKYWLNEVTPQGFSVYGEKNRTTNPIESYHHRMRIRMGSHPGIWSFMAKLKNFQALVRIETFSLDAGQPIRRATLQKYTNREKVLTRMWDLYDEGSMSASRFLSCYNHVSESFKNDYVLTDPAQVDNFLMLPVHDIAVQLPHQDGRIEIEGIEDDDIPILRRNPKEENFSILILENINVSLCTVCKRSVLDLIALPCRHWFFCQACTRTRILQAEEKKENIVCQLCGEKTIAFETVQIS